jgi:flagellar biosynthesis chaperone FliJ
MNQETALNIVLGLANRSEEVIHCKSSKTLHELQQAIRVCQTLSDNRAAKRSWREACGAPTADDKKAKDRRKKFTLIEL